MQLNPFEKTYGLEKLIALLFVRFLAVSSLINPVKTKKQPF